jgi:FtsH-binding integral membrane protein
MRYLKRKLYGLLAFGLWGLMMRCAYVIATFYVPQLPKLGQGLREAVDMMYWIFPVWIIVLILWYFAPSKPPGVGTTLTAKQRKMIKQAQREVGG